MIKRVIFQLAIIISGIFMPVTFASAQFYFGGKTGFQISTHSFGDKEYRQGHTAGFRPGFNIGSATSLKIADKFDIYNEITYSIKGATVQADDNEFVTNRLALQYIDIPLMLRYSLMKHPAYDFFVQSGPTIGFWMKGKEIVTGSEVLSEAGVDKFEYRISFKESNDGAFDKNLQEANRVQLALNIGIGGAFILKNKHRFIVDVRYEMGHTHLSKSSNLTAHWYGDSYDYRVNNQTFMVSTTYLFHLQNLRKKLAK